MRLWRAGAVAGAIALSLAHVGSPDTIFEGQAGPYAVRVLVRTPGVVPGLADITVRITGGPAGPRVVTVIPLRGGLPTAQEPPPDTAKVVPGDSSLYSAQLWLMRFGAYSVRVTVAGAAGSGSAIVPVNAVAVARLDMKRPVVIVLLALGAFLFVGAVTIVAAAVREGVLEPGDAPDAARRRRAWIVAVIAMVAFVGALYCGNAWWNAEDGAFRRRIYRVPEVGSTVVERGGQRVLRFTLVDSSRARQMSPLIPDHGKLMHLFLVSANDQAVAHLHPVLVDSTTFDSALPPLPAGDYYLFADIVHETGFSETLTDTVQLTAAPRATWTPSDPDDAWLVGAGDGSFIRWERPAELRVGADVDLTFAAREGLEPYMGMAGHAIVAREDGGVFVHLHPNGTIPRAAQLVYELREPGDTVRGRLGTRITELRRGEASRGSVEESRTHDGHMVEGETVAFPYAFPSPGRYRVWVQVKSGGRIVTGAFEATVTE